MDWFDRDLLDARIIPLGRASSFGRAPGCRATLATIIILIVAFIVLGSLAGWLHVARVNPATKESPRPVASSHHERP